MKFDLQLRDLTTGNGSTKTFESVDDAKKWLRDRPKGIDVLGVASMHVPREVSDDLRSAMRPLDAEEKLQERQLASARDEAAEKAAAARIAKELEEAKRHQAEMANADPNRPMSVRWTFNAGLSVTDPVDSRAISDEVRDAVKAWVAERDEWVAGRGQVVGDASLQVWPGPLPAGKESRVINGTFIPVTAPKKPN